MYRCTQYHHRRFQHHSCKASASTTHSSITHTTDAASLESNDLTCDERLNSGMPLALTMIFLPISSRNATSLSLASGLQSQLTPWPDVSLIQSLIAQLYPIDIVESIDLLLSSSTACLCALFAIVHPVIAQATSPLIAFMSHAMSEARLKSSKTTHTPTNSTIYHTVNINCE
jgi:hypothetical protein